MLWRGAACVPIAQDAEVVPGWRLVLAVHREDLGPASVWAWDLRELQRGLLSSGRQRPVSGAHSHPLRRPCPLLRFLLRRARCTGPWECCLLSLPLSLSPSGLSAH